MGKKGAILQIAAAIAAIGSCVFTLFSFLGVDKAGDLLVLQTETVDPDAAATDVATLETKPTPTPTPTLDGASATEQQKGPIAIVIDEPTNLRDGPGTVYTVLVRAAKDEQFPVIAQVTGDEDEVWYLIKRPDGAGEAWVASWLVELMPPDAEIPAAETTPIPPPTLAVTATPDSSATADPETTLDLTATPEPAAPTATPEPTGQVCNPGQWAEGCGVNDCAADQLAVCNESGTGWDCVLAPEQCQATAEAVDTAGEG